MLAKQAAKLGQPALALTEHGNLSSVPRLLDACNKHGIKPIIGLEAYFIPDALKSFDKSGQKLEYHRKNVMHLTLLAKNLQGYKNLVKINNLAQNPNRFYYVSRVDWRLLHKYHEGIICLSGCASGPIGNSLIKHDNDNDLAAKRIEKLKNIFDDNFYLEIQPTDYKHQERLNNEAVIYADFFGNKPVVTCDVHYPTKDMERYRYYKWAINRKKTIDEILADDVPTTLYLQTDDEVKQLLSGWYTEVNADYIEQSIATTHDIESQIETYSIKSDVVLPDIELNDPEDTLEVILSKQMKHYGFNTDSVYMNRFNYEWRLVRSKRFSSYFLIVADLVNWARKQKITIGPGRGSVTGSLIAYVLNITQVDPIENNLLFERFLTDDRSDLPDIDIDIQHDKRQLVIDYFKQKYGGQIYNIATFYKIGKKSGIRDLKRVDKTFEGMDSNNPELIESVDKLTNEIRHIGKHAGGFVYSDEASMLPLVNVKGELLSSWTEGVDHRDLNDYGFVKFDLLGVTALSVIDSCKQLTTQLFSDIPLDDPNVFKQFAEAKTDTVFQFNSWSAQRYLKRLNPTVFEDLVAANGLIRPGAADVGMHNEYIKRKNTNDRSWAIHEDIETVLDSTHGVIVYQEQLIELASKLGWLSLSDGEKLRREIIKYGKSEVHSKDELDKLRDKMFRGFELSGISDQKMSALWDNMLAFSRYGFSRNHSFAYTLVSYWQQWFRVYHSLKYFYSYLNFESDADNIKKGLLDAIKSGITILMPDVNKSGASFIIDGDALRFGLSQIKGVGPAATKEIISKRPFSNFDDFIEKVEKRKVNSSVVSSLKREEAFSSLN